MLTAQVLLPGLSSSVPTARHFVESILTSWGRSDAAWTGALLVSELAANCTLHARTEFSVKVAQTETGHIRIEVADGSLRIPQQRAYGVDATTGRGLRLVSELCSDWGVTSHDDGKTVWVDLPPEGAASESVDDDELDEAALLAAFDDEGDDVSAAVPQRRERDAGADRRDQAS